MGYAQYFFVFQGEAGCNDPGIGCPQPGPVGLFDFCLKEQGIYCYLDMHTYRKFKEEDGVPEAERLGDLAKPWCITNRRLIELQKEFCTQIWNHYNPYTKCTYKDEPAIVLSEIINECDLFVDAVSRKTDYEPPMYYIHEFRQQFRTWLEKENISYDWENCSLYTEDEPMIRFKLDVTKQFFREMVDHLRAIGVKIPITGTNWTRPQSAHTKSHEEMDFTDSHHYFYDWRWGNNERICKNQSITSQQSVFSGLARMRIANKPFVVSEWDMPWPNSCRAEGPIYYAAVGALQNWSGFMIHTYSYGTRLNEMKILGRELSSPVGGVPYREGIFSTWNDPAKFGLFYHSALMFRRGDIAPADKKYAIASMNLSGGSSNAWEGVLEQHQAAMVFDEALPEGYDTWIRETETVPHEKPGMIVSDNGQLWRDLKKEIGVVDTPRTKIVYGQLGRGAGGASTNKSTNAGLQLHGLSVNCVTDFGVIALSSLTDEAIETSDNILLSAIGRARNTDALFDGEKMLDAGKPPILAEVIEADIHLKTPYGTKMKVWGVNAEGFYAGKLPTTYEDGVLSFHIGDANNPACYYLIVKE